MRKIDINECHTILLDIAKEFHRICIENNIPYYMLGGTMLGAVRHKGFIPWDDDMDFGIPREHYIRFKEVCKTELKEPYRFIHEDNSNYAVTGVGKIMDCRTELRETFSVDSDEKLGLYIDIFPLDETDDNIGRFSFNAMMRATFKLQKLFVVNPNDRKGAIKWIAKIVKAIVPLKKTTLIKYINRKCLKRDASINKNMIFNIYGAWGFKELIPKEVFSSPVLYQFEDTELYGVANYDEYLKALYSNYMQLPPEDKRHTHTSDIYIH
ncbi:MAG: LicD family protein [Bacteroidaceae bacterium]|nr:LicD family protein [Bacteroidaceae bacterium]